MQNNRFLTAKATKSRKWVVRIFNYIWIRTIIYFNIWKNIADASDVPANADDFIKLVTQEKYDAISAIEKADKKCSDSVLVGRFWYC